MRNNAESIHRNLNIQLPLRRAVYACDYRTRRINALLNLSVPAMITPLELMGVEP